MLKEIIESLLESCKSISLVIRKGNTQELSLPIKNNVLENDTPRTLDILSHNILFENMKKCLSVYGIISEEYDTIIYMNSKGKYIVAFDPINGTDNIKFNITTGTIFAIYKVNCNGFINSGRDIVSAGYCLYGGTTEFVYTEENKVILTKINMGYTNTFIETPSKGSTLSSNFKNHSCWDSYIKKNIDILINEGYSITYTGSIVSDIHRVIMSGGVFLYPANKKNPEGGLNLLYQIYPLAYIIELSGGFAFNTTTKNNILDDIPSSNVHCTAPVCFSSLYEKKLFIG